MAVMEQESEMPAPTNEEYLRSIKRYTDEEKMTMAAVFVTFFVDVAFAASLLGFIVMHANLNFSNMTTIEMYEKKKARSVP